MWANATENVDPLLDMSSQNMLNDD